MSNTFKKTSLRGFTLIELLVVIAIIGLLSTAIMGPVQTGLKKGRDTRKISDLTQVQGALIQYAGDNNGLYPQALTALDPTYMKSDFKFGYASATQNVAARDKFMYVVYADNASNTVQYHLGVALENQNASLQSDVDCTASSTVGTGGWGNLTGSVAPCADGLGTTGTLYNTNYAGTAKSSASTAGNPAASETHMDFGGSGSQEMANGVCTATLSTCIYDVVPK